MKRKTKKEAKKTEDGIVRRLARNGLIAVHVHNYIWAPLPPGDRVAVRHPDGFEQKNDEGNGLFMIPEKCLYGMPSAAREWSKT